MDLPRSFFSPISLILAVWAITLCGCSSTTPPEVRPPDIEERDLFQEMSAFYCKEQRWPATWDEFIAAEPNNERAALYTSSFLHAELSSPRAILLTLRYTNAQGGDRKVSFIAPPECGEAKSDGRVSIAAGRVSFRVPVEFQVLDAKAIKEKWKSGPYPDVAWRDSRGIFITVSFGEVPLTPAEMEGFKEELEEAYESSLPNLSWIDRRIEEVDGSPELVHEFLSESPNGLLVSYVISRSFDGRHLSLSIAGPGERQAEVERVGFHVRQTLRTR
jgi:hypothetical protein